MPAVAIGDAVRISDSPDVKAILQADSTTQYFLPPRMTTAQKNAIASPAEGAVVFDTDLNRLEEYTSALWQRAGGNTVTVSTADVTNPPTDAELDAAFGTPATVGAGFIGVVNDNNGDTNCYFVFSTGASWFYVAGTKAT